MDHHPRHPNGQRPPGRVSTFPPRTARASLPAPARPATRPEDAQPSEAVTSNRRPVAPPSVVPVAQTTLAGGWGSSNQPMRAPLRGRGAPHPNMGVPNGPRWAGTDHSMARGGFRGGPQTTAGGWSSSNAIPLVSGGGTGGPGGVRKGKERQWGTPLPGASSSSSTNAPTSSTISTPVPVPTNPRPRIYISQLPPGITESELRSVFSPFGEIEESRIGVNPARSHTYAHITYANVQSASDAITSLHLQPFPSINGVGPSRPIKVAYATSNRNFAADGTGGAAKNWVVTTEPPALESASELERRLFRERETPESSQVIKKEVSSPVKRIVNVPGQTHDRPSAVNGTGTRSRSRSRSRSDSSRYATPESEHRDSHPNASRSTRRSPSSAAAEGHSSLANRQRFPPFIDPPYLSCDPILFEPTRAGILDSETPLSNPPQISPRYSVSYHFSRRLAETEEDIDVRKLFAGWLHQSLTVPGEEGWKFLVDAESIQVVTSSASSAQADRRSGEAGGAEETGDEDEGEILTFVIQVTNKALHGLGRDTPWTAEEKEQCKLRTAQMKRDLRARLDYLFPQVPVQVVRKPSKVTEVARNGDREQASIEPAQAVLPVEGPQPDGTVIERIPLPLALVGIEQDKLRKQILFRVEEVKKRSLEGKIVLASSIEGNFISINYFVDDSADPPAVPQDLPLARLSNAAPGTAQTTLRSSIPTPRERGDVEMAAAEDVKPVIPNDEEEDMEIDQLDSATPEPRPPEVVRFPLGILKNSRADSVETYQAATVFIDEYFRRFDSSRSSLEGLYTRNAFFSLKIDTTTPRRLTTPVTLFSRQWFQSANRFASTPIAITNSIRRLPAGSHNLNTMLFNARTVPEFHLNKRQRTPILLHLSGEFEEFPDKVVRRFERTFVLVPRVADWEPVDGPGEFMIHSDQLLIGHKVEGEPRELAVLDPPFRPSSPVDNPASRPPAVAAHAQVEARASAGSSAFGQALAPPSPPPPHRVPSDAHLRQAQTEPISRPQSQTRSAATNATVSAVARTSEKRPRHSESGLNGPSRRAQGDADSSSPPPPGIPGSVHRRLSEAELLVLSDTDSAASRRVSSPPPAHGLHEEEYDDGGSRSPEVSRPTKRLHLANGTNGRRVSNTAVGSLDARGPSSTSSASDSNLPTSSTPVVPAARPSLATAAQPPRKSTTSRKADGTGTAGQTTSGIEVNTPTARQTQSLPEEIQRFIAEQVAKEVQEKLRNAAHNASEPAKKRSNKSKDKEEEKSKEKKKKVREQKDTFADGLGTGRNDGRIVLAGPGNSILHGFDGRSNKLRGMIPTADSSSFLAVSFLGDIAELSMQPQNSMVTSSMTKLHSSTQDKFRVDDFTYNRTKDTLIVGYLGAKEGKEMASPPNQVVLYKRDSVAGVSKLTETRLDEAPHVNGGVSAIMALPSKAPTDRLRFVTGGEDKKVYLWTRKRSTQEVKLEKFRTEHTALITSLAYLEANNELVSGGKDRRVVMYDLNSKQATWQATLSTGVGSVSPVVCDPNLILARISTPSQQFLLYDRRIAATFPPVLTFGYDLAPHRSSNGTLVPTNMGRYPRGDQIDTVVAFPDNDQGVKLWDLRQLRSEIVKKQDLAGLGRSKVVQASFRGRDELCLMELAHFTRLTIKG